MPELPKQKFVTNLGQPVAGPPADADVINASGPLASLTGWWTAQCWACETPVWAPRYVGGQGNALPPAGSDIQRPFEHCDVAWKEPRALFVPYQDAQHWSAPQMLQEAARRAQDAQGVAQGGQAQPEAASAHG